jgi:hypothetical protein
VLLNVVVPVAAFVCVRAPVILTTPLNVIAALFVIVKAERLVALPDPMAAKLSVLVVLSVSDSAKLPAVPSIVPEIVKAPEPLLKVGEAASPIVNAPPMLNAVLVVVMLLDKLTSPEVLKPPVAVIAPVAPFVNVPLLVTAVAPEEVKVLFTAKVVPLNVADPTATVPLNVVAPVAAFVCVRAPVILTAPLNVIAALLVTVTTVKLVELPDPKAPTFTIPPDALRISVSADPAAVPSVVPVIVNAPEPLVNVMVVASANVKAPPILNVVFVVVMLLAKLTAPEVLKPPVAVIAPVAPFVNVPLLVTAVAPELLQELFTA